MAIVRHPKPEGRMPNRPKGGLSRCVFGFCVDVRMQFRQFGLRISAFFRPSAFGFRILLLLIGPNLGWSQSPPASQDPMMQLILSQPKIDVDSAVVPVSSFDPPIIRPGEEATFRVTLNALETAIDWPDKIPAPETLSCRAGARGQILSMSGPLLIPRTTFNYRVKAAATGEFTIPEFNVAVNGKSIRIPATQLQVATAVPPGIAPAQQLLFELPTNGLFVGQTIRARVVLPGSPGGMIQSLGQVQINGRGFVVDQSSAHARIEAIPIGSSRRTVSAFVYEMLLTPIATGKMSLFAQGYAVG